MKQHTHIGTNQQQQQKEKPEQRKKKDSQAKILNGSVHAVCLILLTPDIKAKCTMILFSQKYTEWHIFLQTGNGFVCEYVCIPNGVEKSR